MVSEWEAVGGGVSADGIGEGSKRLFHIRGVFSDYCGFACVTENSAKARSSIRDVGRAVVQDSNKELWKWLPHMNRSCDMKF